MAMASTVPITEIWMVSNRGTTRKRRKSRDRSGGNEILQDEIDSQVETFQTDRAEQNHVPRLREDHDSGRGPARDKKPGRSNWTLKHASICGLERLDSLLLDAQLLQHRSRNPVVLASRIHHDVR